MPANMALWLSAKRGELEIKPAPYPTPRDTEIVVRSRALAVNPVDAMMRSVGDFVFPWLKYPAIFGTDVAGEVVEVGPDVTRFKLGDRVLGLACGGDKTRNNPAEGAFQDYVILLEHMASPIPDAMAFENAAVLPLGLSTAACGLFQKDYLALQPPARVPARNGETLLVWGGSTSVGGNAIQLAVAAGYGVITTASPRNFDYCRKLGAAEVFDYGSPTVVADIATALRSRTCAGAIAIGFRSVEACLDIVRGAKGAKFVAIASPSVKFDGAPEGGSRALWLIPVLGQLLAASTRAMWKSRFGRLRSKFIFGSSLVANEVGPMIFRDFLPDALAEGRYVAAPDPMSAGQGLVRLQAAMDILKKGVSARKVVVSL